MIGRAVSSQSSYVNEKEMGGEVAAQLKYLLRARLTEQFSLSGLLPRRTGVFRDRDWQGIQGYVKLDLTIEKGKEPRSYCYLFHYSPILLSQYGMRNL